MSVEQLAAAEHRLQLAQDALQAAQNRDRQSVSIHQYRVMKAEEAVYRARHADEYGNCGCPLCTGRTSWDD